jgi:NAD(P)-dependent dehydrogenase (short-subunit alcohol dehydrogenase family)
VVPDDDRPTTEKKVWVITGAGRGLGVDIAKAALSAGHAVVATGRDAGKVAAAVGDHEGLLAIKLDVTRPQDAQAAVDAAVAKCGRIDVLVNNAGNFFAGFFEELSPDQVRNQLDTGLSGGAASDPEQTFCGCHRSLHTALVDQHAC